MVVTGALVGFGAVARYGHLPWYLNHPFVKLTAIVEPTALGRAASKSLLPDVPVFSNFGELLRAGKVTFVDITAPPAAHHELIIKAASNGIHVICEKPFVTNLQSLKKIESLRHSGGPVISACHNWYFAPAIRRGLEYLAGGLIGDVESVYFHARRPQAARGANHWKPMWRQCASEGGGIIGDLGYHGFYLTSRVFQSSPVSVQATHTDVACTEVEAESSVIVKLDYGKGRQAQFLLSWHHHSRETLFQAVGSLGSLIIEDDTLILKNAKKTDVVEPFKPLTTDSWHAEWIGETLDCFLDMIRTGDKDTYWHDIQWSVSALDAAHTSIKTGAPVDVVI